jgi:hypothetical protein
MRPIRSSAILFLVLALTILYRAVDPFNLLPLIAQAQSTTAVGTGAERLPNLVPNLPGAPYISTCDDPNGPDNTFPPPRIPGSTCIRFDTTTANLGSGPLELRAGEVIGNGKQRVYQRVYNDDCTYQDYVAGEFVYHPQHQHFHFEGYGVYELQPVGAPGGSKRTGAKTSFCILDTSQVNLNLPGAPGNYIYGSCANFQGMSVGYGDTYPNILYGQQIDVSGLPAGNYTLRIIIDAQNRLRELNNADNTSEVIVSLPGFATYTPTPSATEPAGSTTTGTPTATTTAPTLTATPTVTPTATTTPSPTIFIPTASTQSTTPVGVNRLDGIVDLQRASPPDNSWQVPLIVTLYVRGIQTCAASVLSDSTGHFSLTGFENGVFDIRVKHANTLSSQFNSRAFMGFGNTVSAGFDTLLAGDANGDDKITASDFSVLKLTFSQATGCAIANPAMVPCADFNGDGRVSASDFTLLKQNFGRSGPIMASGSP